MPTRNERRKHRRGASNPETAEPLLPADDAPGERKVWLPSWCYHPLSDQATVGFLTKVADTSVMGLVTLSIFCATYLLAWGKAGSACIPEASNDSKDSDPSWEQVFIASLPFVVLPLTLFVSGLVKATETDPRALGVVATLCLIEFVVAIILGGGMTFCVSGASWIPVGVVTLLLIVLMILTWGVTFKHPKRLRNFIWSTCFRQDEIAAPTGPQQGVVPAGAVAVNVAPD
uniref:Uncharacterized protein n=1 Tax=Arundo donax TaxID=35708 RepID=A0A0A8Y261_ARUDO